MSLKSRERQAHPYTGDTENAKQIEYEMKLSNIIIKMK